MFTIMKLKRNMKRLDKMVARMDNELMIYLLNRIGVEMDKRSNEMELIQNAKLEQQLQKEILAQTKEA